MKKGSWLCGLAFAALSIFSASEARADLAAVCPKIQNLSAPALYKYSASGHLASSDRARSCSLIYKKGSSYPRVGSIPMYDANGKLLSSFRAYAMGGPIYGARYYTRTPACSVIAATAKRRAGKAEGYIKINRTTCLKVGNLYGRQGSVK